MYGPVLGKGRTALGLSTARGNVWEGAVRSSKTVGSTYRWMQYVRDGPPGNLLMCGKTERTLKRNIIDPIIRMVGKRRAHYRAGAGELDLFGRTIYTAGAADERAVEKIQGLTLAGAYCDELTTFPESFFEMLGTRMSERGAQWFATCNPASKNHWLYKKYLTRAQLHLDQQGNLYRSQSEDRLSINRFSFTLDDNPYLDPEFVADLKRTYAGLFYRRYILGEWCLAEGAVFDMFDETVNGRHIVDTIPTITRWLSMGVDYGTTNPFHAVMIGLGVDGRLYVVRDWRYDSRKHHRQLTDVEYSQRLRGWLATIPHPGGTGTGVRPDWTVIDPSAASFRKQLYQDGIASKLADNNVLDGIMTLTSLFALGLLRIHVSCVDLIDEISGYSWDDEASEKGLDEPLKIADHGPDALRYGVHTTAALWRPELAMELAA